MSAAAIVSDWVGIDERCRSIQQRYRLWIRLRAGRKSPPATIATRFATALQLLMRP
jgi:hypothetical protein